MSTTDLLTDDKGRFSIQGLMSSLAARLSISSIWAGEPMDEPVRWTLGRRTKPEKLLRGFSGAPTRTKFPPGRRRERNLSTGIASASLMVQT